MTITPLAELREKLTAPVTVIMNAYNASQTIEESIRSVQQQTFSNWQLLVIDDGSTDHTIEVVQDLAKSDPRIVVSKIQHQGLCAGRNIAFEHGRTPYIALLDTDDIAEPERLEKQLRFLEAHSEVAVLGTWGRRINHSGEIISNFDVGPTTVQEYRQRRANREFIHFINSSVMARRSAVLEAGGCRQEDFPAEDLGLWTRIARNHVICALPERLVRYRINQTGISSKTFRRQCLQTERMLFNLRKDESLSLEQYTDYVRGNPLRSFAFEQRYRQRYYFRTGASFLYNDRAFKGACLLALSALANPFYIATRFLKGQ